MKVLKVMKNMNVVVMEDLVSKTKKKTSEFSLEKQIYNLKKKLLKIL